MVGKVKIHSVKYNFIMNFILTASSFIFPLITFPYVARVLGPAGNGLVAFASSTSNYFLMVASLGIPTYGIRACAQVREDNDLMSKTAQEILLINFVITCFATISYVACIMLIPQFSQEKTLFLVYGLSVFINMFGADWLYQAMEQYDYITVRSIAFKLVSIVLMFLFVHCSDDYIVYASICVFAAVGSNILNLMRLPKLIAFKKYSNYHFIRHLKPILILFAQNLAISIYTNLDTVMLGFMKSSEEVGYYNVATSLKGVLLSLVVSLGTVLLPRMSLCAKKKDSDNFERLLVTALNFTICLSIAIVAYCIIEAPDMILLLAGAGYEPAITVMQIISIAVIANGLSGVLGTQTLIALERENVVLFSVAIGAMLDLSLNIILIPSFGANGAAFSTVITEFTVAIIQIIALKTILLRNRHLVHLARYICCGLVAGLACSLCCYMLDSSFVLFRAIVSFVVFVVCFAILLIIYKDEFVTSLPGVSRFMKNGM